MMFVRRWFRRARFRVIVWLAGSAQVAVNLHISPDGIVLNGGLVSHCHIVGLAHGLIIRNFEPTASQVENTRFEDCGTAVWMQPAGMKA